MTITPSMRRYLAEIYSLQQYEVALFVPSVDLTERLNVSASAVAKMIKRLEQKGMVIHERYDGHIELTIEGIAEASKGLRWQRILECFAADVLGFEWQAVEQKARQLIPSMDDEIIEKLAVSLGDPLLSPYGEYIPPHDQLMPPCLDVCLNQFGRDSHGRVTRIRTKIPETRQKIHELGITENTTYTIVGRAPFNGPMRLEILGKDVVLDKDLTHAVWVDSEGKKEFKPERMDIWLWAEAERRLERGIKLQQ